MTTCLGKSCSFCLPRVPFRKLSSIYVFSYFPFGFEGRIWDLIVSVPDHGLSFYNTVVRYFSQGGMSLKDVPTHPMFGAMLELRPTEVFLHIGGNNISYYKNPQDLVDQMEDIVYTIPAARVLVGEILLRGNVKSWVGLSVTEFNDFREIMNNCLFERFGRHCVPFYMHSIFRPEGSLSSFYSTDLVHMSNPVGTSEVQENCLLGLPLEQKAPKTALFRANKLLEKCLYNVTCLFLSPFSPPAFYPFFAAIMRIKQCVTFIS